MATKSRVDTLSDLDNLLAELEQVPQASTKSKARQSATFTAVKESDWDELDALVAKFDDDGSFMKHTLESPTISTPSSVTASTPTQSAPQQPMKAPSTPSPSPAPKPVNTPTNSYPSSTPSPTTGVQIGVVVKGNSTPNTNTDLSCPSCGQKVVGEHILALGRMWHLNHFNCASCTGSLEGEFYEHGGQHVCKKCMAVQLKCTKCGLPITGEYLTGNGKTLHPECLDKIPCAKCARPITTAEVNALNKKWHPECFICFRCNAKLTGTFYCREGQPLCPDCMQGNKSSLSCYGCNQGLTGSYISYEDRYYHSDCFKCFGCRKLLNHEAFFRLRDQPHCQACAEM